MAQEMEETKVRKKECTMNARNAAADSILRIFAYDRSIELMDVTLTYYVRMYRKY